MSMCLSSAFRLLLNTFSLYSLNIVGSVQLSRSRCKCKSSFQIKIFSFNLIFICGQLFMYWIHGSIARSFSFISDLGKQSDTRDK